MKFYLLAAFLFVTMMAVMAIQLEEPSVDSFSYLSKERYDSLYKGQGGAIWLCNAACWSRGKPAGVWEGNSCVCKELTETIVEM